MSASRRRLAVAAAGFGAALAAALSAAAASGHPDCSDPAARPVPAADGADCAFQPNRVASDGAGVPVTTPAVAPDGERIPGPEGRPAPAVPRGGMATGGAPRP